MTRKLLILFILFGFAWNAYAVNRSDSWNFKVYLDDKPVGFHTFTIDGESADQKLKSVARFDVDFFIITAYSYQHESNERWTDDCLAEIKASTNDNGEKLLVQGQSIQGKFDLATPKGKLDIPGCVMTFAYWNPKMLSQKRLLNPQNGEYVDVDIKPIGQESIKVNGKNIPASHYRLISEKFLIDLWYSPDQRWVALDSTLENGRILHYRIE